jgi:hypothetical protein
MNWILIAAAGVLAWLALASFFIALCHQAGRADDLAGARDGDVIDLGAFSQSRTRPARRRPYLRSRDSRRSLSSLPSV